VQQQRPGRPKGVDQLPGGLRSEADQVDDRVGAQLRDPLTERPGGVLGIAVSGHALHRPPFRRLAVGRPLASGHRDDVMSGTDQPRHQVAADMSGCSDHHYTTQCQHLPLS
jgi:hypothetical protein